VANLTGNEIWCRYPNYTASFCIEPPRYGSGCVIIQTFTAYTNVVILTVYGLLRRYLDRVTSPMDGPSGELGVVLNGKKGLRLSLVDAEC
jgi:hypothetical protein